MLVGMMPTGKIHPKEAKNLGNAWVQIFATSLMEFPSSMPQPIKVTPEGGPGSEAPRTRPLIILCQLFGVLPVSLLGRKPSMLPAYLFYFILTAFLILSKSHQFIREWDPEKETKPQVIMLALYTSLGLPDAVATLLHVRRAGLQGEQLIENLRRFQLKRCPQLISLALPVIGVLFYTLVIWAMYILFNVNLMAVIVIYILNVTTYLIMMLFCNYLALIKESVFESLPIHPSEATSSILGHIELIQKAAWANDFFSAELLFYIARITLNIIIKLYSLLFAIMSESPVLETVTVRVATVCWEFYNLSILTYACNGVMKQMELYDQELYLVIRRSPSLLNNDKIILYVNKKPRITFSACGFFNIGYPLVTSIIAAALTYLVILVQFSK